MTRTPIRRRQRLRRRTSWTARLPRRSPGRRAIRTAGTQMMPAAAARAASGVCFQEKNPVCVGAMGTRLNVCSADFARHVADPVVAAPAALKILPALPVLVTAGKLRMWTMR